MIDNWFWNFVETLDKRNIYGSTSFTLKYLLSSETTKQNSWIILRGRMTFPAFNNATERRTKPTTHYLKKCFCVVEENKYLIRALETFAAVNLFILLCSGFAISTSQRWSWQKLDLNVSKRKWVETPTNFLSGWFRCLRIKIINELL